MAQKNRRRRNFAHEPRARRGLVLLALLLGALLVGASFFDDMGLARYLSMRDHAEELEQEILRLQTANEALREEIRQAEDDPQRIEALARERLGFVREGETVYTLLPDAQR